MQVRWHDFVIIIPVADRPQHLAACLASLRELCRHYPYDGKITVLIADDSREPDNIVRHRVLAEQNTAHGLPTHHLGQEEQQALIAQLPAALRAQLGNVLGSHDAAAFHHKGASITRNIAYLWLSRLPRDSRRLFWFIDSDQEFRVNLATPAGEEERFAIDYFHALDRIFSQTATRVLTGKVVGDPPVSPAVMAGNFLDDVCTFLHDLAQQAPRSACTFHAEARHADDAAYHDMAELFGFRQAEAFRYHCSLQGPHDHFRCFADFAGKLGRFFDGEHPTRRSVYQPGDALASLAPARTIYTGNYVISTEGLDYFIPFAALKLRMAGPTLGRIIKAELGDTFVSANLPMLHRRTVTALGQSEFRPGVERASGQIDLSAEFERQYFGDVMLFSMERLMQVAAECEPHTGATGTDGAVRATHPAEEEIADVVDQVEAELHAQYTAKHREVCAKIARLEAAFTAPEHWWHADADLAEARNQFRQFIANMQHNFGNDARAWQLVNDSAHRQSGKAVITAAIARYPEERATWHTALAAARSERA